MAWQTEMVLMLRTLINDVSDSPTYTDNRLIDLLMVSAHMVMTEIAFDTTYIIDFDTTEITPDPTDRAGGTRDDNFINLVLMKSACILSRAESKERGGQSIDIKDGKSAISTSDRAKISLEISKDLCSVYDNAKFDYAAGRSTNIRVVTGPYRFERGGNEGSGY